MARAAEGLAGTKSRDALPSSSASKRVVSAPSLIVPADGGGSDKEGSAPSVAGNASACGDAVVAKSLKRKQPQTHLSVFTRRSSSLVVLVLVASVRLRFFDSVDEPLDS